MVQGTPNVLWLPSDYRATCSAVQNNVLVIGHAPGHVSILEIDIVGHTCIEAIHSTGTRSHLVVNSYYLIYLVRGFGLV